MTIIAYRDGVLAADSQLTDCNRRVGYVQKLSCAPDGTIGAATGRDSACHRFHRWVEGGMSGIFFPECESGTFGAFVVHPGGKLRRMDHTGCLTSHRAPFNADGCGDNLAIGAMAMGATAEQAVQVAIDWDPGCGGDIQMMRVPGWQQEAK